MLVRVGDTDILLGVAQGPSARCMCFPWARTPRRRRRLPSTTPKLPNFKDLLMRSLGK